MWRNRTKLLVGEEGIKKLEKSSIAIIGVGGVGGYTAIMLARAGVGKITLVDFDVVDISNINRQVVANVETVGKLKTEVMKDMIMKINPSCEVNAISTRFSAETKGQIFTQKFDYVIDAIDSVQDKVDLIDYCKKNNIQIVSAMGAGNRIAVPLFEVVDIYKTKNDGLAKVMRKKLRERQVQNLDVVCCKFPAMKIIDKESQDEDQIIQKKTVGSVSYYPAMCGCVLSAFVIENLLG
ncbi:MAG: ThiF family adenylyltransferase [Clostridia bacterium]|nr:ThiF family adenylyltransferase [Clostridia bacterium]